MFNITENGNIQDSDFSQWWLAFVIKLCHTLELFTYAYVK